jgi:DNA (cytosine-5)-methyltransferase 1
MASQLADLAANPPPTGPWGRYQPAIGHWADITGRPAPPPGLLTANGWRENTRFIEWAMGLADGWVTDPRFGLSRSRTARALGNGVVPRQAETALAILKEHAETAIAAQAVNPAPAA